MVPGGSSPRGGWNRGRDEPHGRACVQHYPPFRNGSLDQVRSGAWLFPGLTPLLTGFQAPETPPAEEGRDRCVRRVTLPPLGPFAFGACSSRNALQAEKSAM